MSVEQLAHSVQDLTAATHALQTSVEEVKLDVERKGQVVLDLALVHVHSAEAAADVAQLSVGIFDSMALGLLATTSGKYFSVPSPESSEYLILYKNNSGLAAEIKRYPSSTAISGFQYIPRRLTDIEAQFTVSRYEPQVTVVRTTLLTGTLDGGYAFGIGQPTKAFDYIKLGVERLLGNQKLVVSIYRRLVSEAASLLVPGGVGTDVLVQQKEFTVADLQPIAGFQEIELVIEPVEPAANYVTIIQVLSFLANGTMGVLSIGRGADGAAGDQVAAGWYFRAGTYPAGFRLTTSIRVACDVGHKAKALPDFAPVAVVGVVDEHSVDIADLSGLLTEQIKQATYSRTPTTQFAVGSFTQWAVGYSTPDGHVDYLSIPSVTGLTSVATVELTLYRRASNYIAAPGAVGDTQILQRVYTRDELTITQTTQELTFEFDQHIQTNAGEVLLWVIRAFNSIAEPVNFAVSYNNADVATAQIHKGYYKTTASWSSITTSGAALAFTMGEYVRVAKPTGVADTGAARDLLDGVDVVATAVGSTLTVEGTVTLSGIKSLFSKTTALTLPASGSERFDIVVINKATLALTVVPGVTRVGLDGIEYIPAVPTGCLKVATVLVSNALYVCNTSSFDNLTKVGTEGERYRLVERNKRALRKTMGKLVRGLPIKLAAYGDSIDAIQNLSGLGSMPYTANGVNRDRPEYYFTNYASDTIAAIPKFDFTDGAGAVHCKVGRAWRLVEALERSYGVAVTYLNFGIGSTNSQNTQHNGLWPARLAEVVNAAPDLVTLSFGMNELGAAYTFANTVAIAQALQAVGAEVIIQGVPRVNAAHGASTATWQFTNGELERAAIAVGAAYVPTTWIADDRNLGGIGVPTKALCATNKLTGYNHPGRYELAKYGDNLVELSGL